MEDRTSDRWVLCKQTLQRQLSEEDAEAWLSPLQLVSLGPEKAVLGGIPNTFFRNRIRRRFAPLLRECLSEAFPTLQIGERFSIELNLGASGEAPGAALHPKAPPAAAGGEAPPAGQSPPRYRFDNFLEGPHNRDALRFARKVAASPGQRYNPLLLVGAVGLGKTHLLRAIAHQLGQRFAPQKVVYTTAEAFANEVVDGIRGKKMARVREVFRQADALLVDDIDFLAVSPKSQMELLHTFQALQAAGKQMVFSAIRFPAAIAGLDPALRSRLEGGLIVDIAPPDEQARLNLIAARAAEEGIDLPEESARLLARRISAGPRQLEGALLRLGAYASLHETPLTPDFVQDFAAPFFDPEPAASALSVAPDKILGAVCDHFGTTITALRGKGRTARLVEARRVAVYLLHDAGRLSFAEIGALLGNRTHATMFKTRANLVARLEAEPALKAETANLRASLGETEQSTLAARTGL